jgi:zinc/manganese transport system substrate-binding protein
MTHRAACVVGLIVMLVVAGCGVSRSTTGRLHVVAAENFWGSIAQQLGGQRVSVLSIVSDPNADPHEYESSATDARAIATADEVIVNGAGYDSWAQRLLSAGGVSGRRLLDVASLVGAQPGANPHLWYDPAVVERVADAITADYTRLDSAHAAYYRAQRKAFETALAPYHRAIARIRARLTGTRVGSTESIFVYMSRALGLDLISPPEFMKAVAEGTEPPAQTVVTFQKQVNGRQIRELVFNVQTATSVTTNLRAAARAAGIPVVGISETLQPTGATFEDWQVRQLDAIEAGLKR